MSRNPPSTTEHGSGAGSSIRLRRGGPRQSGDGEWNGEQHVALSPGEYTQLTGRAGEMQVKDAKLAGVYNMGGAAVANYVSILEPLR